MKHVFVSMLLAVLLGAGPARAQDGSDDVAIQTVISSQIAAFRNGDGELAYSFAAPNIKRMFPSSRIFMQMVETAYAPVYRPRSFGFIDQELGGNEAVQLVDLVGPDGGAWIAMYTLQRQDDGSWKITSCRLKPGVGA